MLDNEQIVSLFHLVALVQRGHVLVDNKDRSDGSQAPHKSVELSNRSAKPQLSVVFETGSTQPSRGFFLDV